jgi:hypothetical protein
MIITVYSNNIALLNVSEVPTIPARSSVRNRIAAYQRISNLEVIDTQNQIAK